MINEDNLIKVLESGSCGFIGNDAAILPHVSADNRYIITKDLLAEDVHFRIRYFTPFDLAHKALHVNLSDLAAMGAEPLYILCGISIPDVLQDYASDFLNALTAICQKTRVILIGGDTTASKDHLFVSISAIGQVPSANIKYRNTARRDDIICIVGNMGFAYVGFNGLEQSMATDSKYTNSFLRPEAKMKEGIWLGKHASVTSMMDVSDGLYIDLKRLCAASNKGAVLDIDLLQIYLEPEISLHIALEGGEDYGLLVTIDKDSFETLSQAFSKEFDYDFKVIGHINDGHRISFRQGNQMVDLDISPFTHFGKK